jgi:PAS domain S-box-containing protein
MKPSKLNKQDLTNQAKSGNWQIAIVILIAGLALTLISTLLLKQDEEVQAKKEFSLISKEIRTRVERRLNSHALLLRNGASFFEASDSVTRAEWKLFIENSRLDKYLPGIEGVGFSYIIPPSQLQKHIQKIRQEGFPDYTVKPEGKRDIYTSILYLEPFSGRNLRAFGYDMFSEPIRRKAMEEARDFNVAALSGKVILVQETGKDLQAGTLMYAPVYRHGMALNTVEQRRKAIIGWVYSPYRMVDLMQGMLGRWDSTEMKRVHLKVYDDENMQESSLLFDSQAGNLHHKHNRNTIINNIILDFNGHKWVLNLSQTEGLPSYFSITVVIVFISGVLISFLLFALYLALSKARRRMALSEQLSSQLKESEEKHRALIENATEGIYVVKNGHIAFANRACEAITGIPHEDMIGMPIKEFLDTEESDKLAEQHNQLIVGEVQRRHSEISIRNRLGEHKWLLINSAQIMWIGSAATLNLATDVTERKKAEEEISRKNEELENLNATKDKFFSIIAHDLRSPFNSLLGLTEMLSVDLPHMSKIEVQPMVDSIYKSTNNMYRLLENLLQWSQIQSGTIPFNPKPVLLVKVFHETIDIIREAASLKEIEITVSVNDQLQVKTDYHMLHTIMRNLISNAIKFTPKGGKIIVSASSYNDHSVVISVRDTGIGINQTMLSNLFRIDVKTSRMGTESEPSTGLGLLLCKEFVEKQGGKIWVESAVGKGSVFHFTTMIAHQPSVQ